MKRQRLELVTCASLVVYAAIVLAGQALHLLPGWGCHCHSGLSLSRSALDTDAAFMGAIETFVAPDTERCGFQRSSLQARIEPGTFTETDRSCPACHWFSIAQQNVQPVRFAFEVTALSSLSLPDCGGWDLAQGSILPRGPPLLLVSACTL